MYSCFTGSPGTFGIPRQDGTQSGILTFNFFFLNDLKMNLQVKYLLNVCENNQLEASQETE